MRRSYEVDVGDPDFCRNLLLTVLVALLEEQHSTSRPDNTRERKMLEMWLSSVRRTALQ
jgi:hypothetical protein